MRKTLPSATADLAVFVARPQGQAMENLRRFVLFCRDEVQCFGVDLPFDENVWDLTGHVIFKGKDQHRIRAVFSKWGDDRPRAQREYMSEPFLSFAKAYLRYSQGLHPAKDLAPKLTTLRILAAALEETGAHLVTATGLTFNRAMQIASERLSPSNRYSIGQRLQTLADFLNKHRLTTVWVRWTNPVSRNKDLPRVGRDFDGATADKMPSPTALEAIPKLFNLARTPVDRVITAALAVLCAAPNRIHEVLLMRSECEVRQQTGGVQNYGLRWWPGKGASPMVKWIIPSMASVVVEAIRRIRFETEEARAIALWYEINPEKIHLLPEFEHLRAKSLLTMNEVAVVLYGHAVLPRAGSRARQWCVAQKVELIRVEGDRRIFSRFADLEKAVLQLLPIGFPYISSELGLRYSEALFVSAGNGLSLVQTKIMCLVEPIDFPKIRDALGGRNAHGVESIFDRMGFFEADGSSIKLRTHQLRHYLNTIANSGGLSAFDIAKWSGRLDVRQNAVYDHVSAADMLLKIRSAVGDRTQMIGALANVPKSVPIQREEFARLKIPTAHTTDFGFCIHDYTMSPCQIHGDCLSCEELVCIKGDAEKTAALNRRCSETRILLAEAQKAEGKSWAGASRWTKHHHMELARLEELCALMEDPAVPEGAVIHLGPTSKSQQLSGPMMRGLSEPKTGSLGRSKQLTRLREDKFAGARK